MKLIQESLSAETGLRIKRLQGILRETGGDALLVSSNANIYYTTMRYFRGYVWIPAKGEPLWFPIRPKVFDDEPFLRYIRKPEDIPAELEKEGFSCAGKTILFEEEAESYSDILRLRKAFAGADAGNGSGALRRSRMVKTPFEIELMKEDGLHQCAAYRRFTKAYREGMSDVEFQIELERILRLEGALGYSRKSGNLMEINLGSVIAGDNADNPTPFNFSMGGAGTDPSLPVGADGEIIRTGQTVMVDMNGAFNGYQTDLTRIWRLGEISDLAWKAQKCNIRILRELEKLGTPGTTVKALYERAVEIVKEEGLENYFMGHRQKAAFIGHGVGIELNEMPVVTGRSSDILMEGMTLALEPKFVVPGTGAVGNENTYVVRPSGLENITPFPDDIQEFEQ